MPDAVRKIADRYTCPRYTVAVCDLAVERLVAGCAGGRWVSCRWHATQGTNCKVLRYFDVTARLMSRTADVVQALNVVGCKFTLQELHFGQSQGFAVKRPDRPRSSSSPSTQRVLADVFDLTF